MTDVYAARLKNEDELMRSSSGGVFTALLDSMLSKGNAIVCAIYNYDSHQVEYRLCNDRDIGVKARGSKYIQSVPGDIFETSEKWLRANPKKKLLFIGMGCQAAGFRSYISMKGLLDRTYIVDIICMGVPSPKLWRDVAIDIEKKNNGKITYLTFKDKCKGWDNPTAYVVINGKKVGIDEYQEIFYGGNALRPSCYACPYPHVDRDTDLTIGDYWGIKKKLPGFYSSKGTSIVLVRGERGAELFKHIANRLEYRMSNLEGWLQPHLRYPFKKPKTREDFWNEYNKGISFVLNKYGKEPICVKLARKFKQNIIYRVFRKILESMSEYTH